ncbi:MAG: hypothetical protein ACREJU_17025, partial [Nitrospiraceae bacterium]
MFAFAMHIAVSLPPRVLADILNPEDLVRLMPSFWDFCLEHPWLSMPVALLIFISIIVHLSKVLGAFINSTYKGFMHGSSLQRTCIVMQVVVLVGVSASAPWIA